MQLLQGVIRTYAWGSRTAIAEFTGRPSPAVHPEAELWLGAHPGDPALLESPAGNVSLLEAIGSDPEGQLGVAVRDEFGDRLPFLVKVLAAEEPLSLQAHPSARQAREGYQREQQRGLPVNSPVRNYRDPNHKPELLVALSDFHALAGFRPADRSVALMRALNVPALRPYIALLTDVPGELGADGLRAVFTTWITLPQPDLDVLIPAVLEAAVAYIRSGATEFTAEVRTVLELGERYPGDAGVLAAMLLNRISLVPGQGIYLSAGNLHSYLHGVGMEVMANSDNVLRGGLTPKHVDVPELLRVLDFTPVGDVRVGTRTDGIETVYETPAAEFAASVLTLENTDLGHEVDAPARHDGPQILVCTRGSVIARSKSDEVRLDRGSSAWVAADDGPIRLQADEASTIFRATVGL